MPDTPRTVAELKALFADNSSGDISAQDLRDFVESVTGKYLAFVFTFTVPDEDTTLPDLRGATIEAEGGVGLADALGDWPDDPDTHSYVVVDTPGLWLFEGNVRLAGTGGPGTGDAIVSVSTNAASFERIFFSEYPHINFHLIDLLDVGERFDISVLSHRGVELDNTRLQARLVRLSPP